LNEEKRRSARRKEFIMAELLETERSYVKDLELVVKCFLVPMSKGGPDVPGPLRGKESIVFGNVEEILSFHKGIFLKELEKYETMPEDVGHCFVTWVSNENDASSWNQFPAALQGKGSDFISTMPFRFFLTFAELHVYSSRRTRPPEAAVLSLSLFLSLSLSFFFLLTLSLSLSLPLSLPLSLSLSLFLSCLCVRESIKLART
jgi:hypothetical protein